MNFFHLVSCGGSSFEAYSTVALSLNRVVKCKYALHLTACLAILMK